MHKRRVSYGAGTLSSQLVDLLMANPTKGINFIHGKSHPIERTLWLADDNDKSPEAISEGYPAIASSAHPVADGA